VRSVVLSFFFLFAKFCPFDAGMLKLQQMIKWDVFLEHGVYRSGHREATACAHSADTIRYIFNVKM